MNRYDFERYTNRLMTDLIRPFTGFVTDNEELKRAIAEAQSFCTDVDYLMTRVSEIKKHIADTQRFLESRKS